MGLKKTTKKHDWTDIKVTIDAHKYINDLLKEVIRDERGRAFSCERSRIDELDKAVCQMQKTLRSFEVKINRIESEVKMKK